MQSKRGYWLKLIPQFSSIIQEILDLDQTKAFLDTSKIINHALFLSMVKAFDFYVIWLVRDPRAQVNSAIKYNDWSVEKNYRAERMAGTAFYRTGRYH